jgi:GNAT superfamily N-acetyltransferase
MGVAVSRDPSPLIAHWGVVSHLQTQLSQRNEGIGSALMRRLREVARDEMGLEQLHLAARGGDDTRDEILMILTPL